MDQLEALASAWERYQEAAHRLGSIQPCRAAWPADPPGPDYAGTLCDLLDGHDQGDRPTPHRHRIKGSQVVVTW